MADYLRANDVRRLSKEDRTKRLNDLRNDLMHERGIAAMGGSPPSPGKMRQIRRQIQRLHTIEREEQLGIVRATRQTDAAGRPIRSAKGARPAPKKEG